MKQNEDYWHKDDLPLGRDCDRCPDFGICGGVRSVKTPNSCLSLCSCKPNSKDGRGSVCKCDAKHLVQRMREVGGWDLEVPRAPLVPSPSFPQMIPLIYGKSNRERVLGRSAVSIPIHSVFSRRTGELSVDSHEALCEKFLIDQNTQIILSSVHHDPTIEGYWSLGRSQNIAAKLRTLGLDLITTPNFSLFPDVQR